MQHKNFDELISNLEVRQDSYVFGPTGSGKTRGIFEASKILGLPFYKKLIGNQTTEASILGYMDAGGRYVEGIAFKPFTTGGVLLFDEVDNGNPNTNLTINGLADGEIAFPIGMKTRHPDCVVVASANTINGATLEYVGRNRQDAAFLGRFVFVSWPYDSELEKQICEAEYKNFGGDTNKLAEVQILLNDINKFRLTIRELKLSSIIISPRTSLQAIRKLAKCRPATEILKNVILKGVEVELAKKIIDHSKNIKLVIVNKALHENAQYITEVLNKEVVNSAITDIVAAPSNPFPEKKIKE